ncbi:VOC family protein [Motilibacter aurantiacus]|uniref:VOC family protein n=1 Tax=Motilibacter aurantiacus TaxID=2714955 RepID=UPI001408D770|nr:VOC family protein [Motilibacter aurantiacus]NHC47653.1 VOC family protein [Motilibacter aurantiacus]
MEQRLSLVTLGVRDLARAKRFYDALGWRGQEAQETVFYQAGGIAVVLWSRAALAADSGLEDAPMPAFGGIVLAHNVRSRRQVDDILASVEAAGGRVTKPAQETFYGGYAGSFVDPDGHPWEVAHNPGFGLAEDGALVLPDLSAG